MRVEHPIDHFSVDYVRSNHSLVDRVWVLLPLADGHLQICCWDTCRQLSLAQLSFHSLTVSQLWLNTCSDVQIFMPPSGERRARGPLWKWQNFTIFSAHLLGHPLANMQPECSHRLQVTVWMLAKGQTILKIALWLTAHCKLFQVEVRVSSTDLKSPTQRSENEIASDDAEQLLKLRKRISQRL